MSGRYFPRHRHLAAADQADIGDGVVGGATGARGDSGGACAGEASAAVEARGLAGLGRSCAWQNRN